jgi:hypothetical protein
MSYTIKEFDINTVAETGWGSIDTKVDGFWSGNSITLYLQRNARYSNDMVSADWKISISHSSGGRDTKGGINDIDAAINFGNAMIGVAELARDIETNHLDKLEASYVAYRAEQARIEAEKKSAAEAELAADPAVGDIMAKTLISALTINHRPILSFHRGNTERQQSFMLRGTKATIYLNGNRISKADATRILANMSLARTTVMEITV